MKRFRRPFSRALPAHALAARARLPPLLRRRLWPQVRPARRRPRDEETCRDLRFRLCHGEDRHGRASGDGYRRWERHHTCGNDPGYARNLHDKRVEVAIVQRAVHPAIGLGDVSIKIVGAEHELSARERPTKPVAIPALRRPGPVRRRPRVGRIGRFASRQNARFGQPEVGVGLVPGGGALEWLPGLVGRSRALEFVLSADDLMLDIAEAYGWVTCTCWTIATSTRLSCRFRR